MIRRLVGGAIALGVLVGVSSCSEPPAAPAEPGHASHAAQPPRALRGGERFVTVTMPAAYRPAAPHGGTDEYRCFLVDPGITADAFLTGSEFLPQNPDIVHHAIFFRVDPAQVAEAKKTDAGAPGEGWTCFGDAGIPGDPAWVAHWAPGTHESMLAPGIGYPMPPGSQLVMQVHYNLLSTKGKAGPTDRSGMRMRLSGEAGLTALETMLLPAPVELPCATGESGPLCDRAAAVDDVAARFGPRSAGTVQGLNQRCNQGRPPAAGATQHCDRAIVQSGTIYGVGGHMHLLGRSITIELNGKPLLSVPAFDFDEQAVVPPAEPVAVRPGDTLRVTCTHDASLRRRLPQLRQLPPRYVVWGEGTSDEMCLGLVVWSPA